MLLLNMAPAKYNVLTSDPMNSKSTIWILFLMIIPISAMMAQGSLEVTITGVKSDKGSIRVGLFTEQDYLKTPVVGQVIKAAKGSVTVRFESVADGTYAISVIHDANENGELDTNKLGIPREGFAFSNNAAGTLGPPSYEKAKIEIQGAPLKQELVMKYL